jgi:hypothetical protein
MNMDALEDYADERLLDGCIYCGGPIETREHVPSRSLLDDPKPDNLPVVGACESCNKQFSKDEEYLACLIDCVIAGSTDPALIRRSKVAKMLRHSPALQARIGAAKSTNGEQVQFSIEVDRVRNVITKLAQGHSAFELSQCHRHEPETLHWQPLELMDPHARDLFEAPEIVQQFGELGTRSMQRMVMAQVSLQSADGKMKNLGIFVNDWIVVQEGRYRYLASDCADGIQIRMVIGEYLACLVCWSDDE